MCDLFSLKVHAGLSLEISNVFTANRFEVSQCSLKECVNHSWFTDDANFHKRTTTLNSVWKWFIESNHWDEAEAFTASLRLGLTNITQNNLHNQSLFMRVLVYPEHMGSFKRIEDTESSIQYQEIIFSLFVRTSLRCSHFWIYDCNLILSRR